MLAGNRGLSDDLYDRFAELTFYVMVTYVALESLIRFILSKAHLTPLIYFYMPFTFVAGFWWLGRMFRQHTAITMLFSVLTLFHIGVGMYVMQDYRQVGVGVRLMVNILLAGAIAPYFFSDSLKTQRFLLGIFAANAVGLMLNHAFGKMPWNEVSFDLGGIQVSGSGVLLAGDGSFRAAGFTRTNHVAAAIASVFPMILSNHIRQKWLCVIIAAFGVLGIVETNQKSVISFFMVVILPVLCLPPVWRSLVLRGEAIVFTALVILVPVALVNTHFEMQGLNSSLYSLLDRVDNTWPDSWNLIFRHGMGFMGRGIGGVGQPQRTFAINDYTPIDNFFLYFFGWFGILAVPYIIMMILPVARSRRLDGNAMAAMAAIAFSLSGGITASVMQEPMTTFCMFGPVFFLATAAAGKGGGPAPALPEPEPAAPRHHRQRQPQRHKHRKHP